MDRVQLDLLLEQKMEYYAPNDKYFVKILINSEIQHYCENFLDYMFKNAECEKRVITNQTFLYYILKSIWLGIIVADEKAYLDQTNPSIYDTYTMKDDMFKIWIKYYPKSNLDDILSYLEYNYAHVIFNNLHKYEVYKITPELLDKIRTGIRCGFDLGSSIIYAKRGIDGYYEPRC